MLTPRLKHILNLVENCDVVGDVGTDHGYLAVELINENKAKYVIATDINEKPLQKATSLIEKSQLEKFATTRIGTGLSVFEKNECNVTIIAGMGGYLIRDILLNDLDIAHSNDMLILQPMNNAWVLRQMLNEKKFLIVAEELIKENHHIYEIVVVKNGKMTEFTEMDAYLGYHKVRKKTSIFEEFLSRKIKKEIKKIQAVTEKNTLKAQNQKIKSTKW